MRENANPYNSPVDCQPGEWDRTLLKRACLVSLIVAAWFLLIVSGILWAWWDGRTLPSDATTWERIIAFFFGWH
jgi:hypothetical protein